MNFREQGKIESVRAGRDPDRDWLTCWIFVSWTGATQGFGGLVFETEAQLADFVGDVCRVFGVGKLAELVGKPCTALWCYAENNYRMEGIEAESGLRFTIYDFQLRHFPATAVDPLEDRRESCRRTIAWAKRRLADAQRDLERAEAEYHPWPVSDDTAWAPVCTRAETHPEGKPDKRSALLGLSKSLLLPAPDDIELMVYPGATPIVRKVRQVWADYPMPAGQIAVVVDIVQVWGETPKWRPIR